MEVLVVYCVPGEIVQFCNHPNYNYPQCYDLSIDPEPILSLSYQDLKKRMNEKPKFLKTLSHNKHPSIFNNNYFFEINNISKTEKDLFENVILFFNENMSTS